MSSAPSGLDVREYAYGYFSSFLVGATPHVITAHNRWLVTKIQIFAAAADVDFVLLAGGGGTGGPSDIIIRAGGCLCLEPNGAFRGDITIGGEGALIIVEFWWQPDRNTSYPVVVTT
jgi:hypothetical protein